MLTFDSAEITNYSLTNGTKSHDYVLSADFSVITFKISNFFVIFMIIMFCDLTDSAIFCLSSVFALLLSNKNSLELALKMYEQQNPNFS